MKKIIRTTDVVLFCTAAHAQELFVNTHTASNMAAESIGFPMLFKLYKMNHHNSFSSYRIEPELTVNVF